MAKENQTQILVVSDKNAASSSNGSNSTQNSSGSNAPKWNVIIKTDIYINNTLLRPDGYSSIWFENIGEDRCNIFDSVPVNPESQLRKFENDPGQIIASQVPIQFEKKSADRRLLVTKIYYEKIG
jgi:hypothetical protein